MIISHPSARLSAEPGMASVIRTVGSGSRQTPNEQRREGCRTRRNSLTVNKQRERLVFAKATNVQKSAQIASKTSPPSLQPYNSLCVPWILPTAATPLRLLRLNHPPERPSAAASSSCSRMICPYFRNRLSIQTSSRRRTWSKNCRAAAQTTASLENNR